MVNRDTYRGFRSSVMMGISAIKAIDIRQSYRIDDDDSHPLRALRAAISEFRSDVAYRLSELLSESHECEPHVRRALGIHASLPLFPDKWGVAGQFSLCFLPEALVMRRARRLLERVHSFEGRRHIFMHFIRRSLPQLDYYDERLDFSFRYLQSAGSIRELVDIQRLEVGLLKAGLRLGIRTPAKVAMAFPFMHDRLAGGLMLVLVEEGAIQSAEELSWATRKAWNSSGCELTAVTLRLARATVRCLISHGIDRRLVAGVFQHALGGLAPDHLAKNLCMLKTAGITDLSTVFARVGDQLWRAPTANWQFVLETVGARSAEDIGRFKPLLESHRKVSLEVVRGLLALGADLDGLAGCQQMLLALASNRDGVPPPLGELELLAASPHALRFEQIAECATYLDGKRELAPFLNVLVDHNYGSADAVLAFQVCYASVSTVVMNRLLVVLDKRGHGELTSLVATWVLQASQGGHLDAFEYLVTAVDMPGLASLQQALKLVPLGEPLLRYLVEDRGLTTFKAIRDWYYREANGIDGYRSWRAFDAVDRALLDDACERKQFNQLDGNQRCIAEAVSDRIKDELGPFPFGAAETDRAAHHWRRDQATLRERAALVSSLPVILRRTGGVLLQSLLEGAWEGIGDLEERLARLTPLMEDLLAGRGPTGTHLTPLEVDAIALIYRSSAANVMSQWSQLTGREQDITRLTLRPHYPVAWTQTRWQLQHPLDRKGFFALLKAAECAGRFVPSQFHDMFTACQRLSPKQLNERSADIASLALHLGVLLSIGAGDDVVAHWTHKGFDAMTRIDDESLLAYQRLGELVALFDVVLPDALEVHVDRFVRRFSDDQASYLASRLGVKSNEARSNDGRDRLRHTLTCVRDKALPIYLAWARREWRKFGKSNSACHERTQLNAIVSKYPAAFFAKAAVNLCTGANVEMWREVRHSHLLVMEPAGQRLAGMALLYIEVLSAVDPTRPSLVIRAINPTDEMLSGHAGDSIVEGFFDVAICIAQENKLACVAFPSPSGMHLMSNREVIEDILKDRYIKRSERQVTWDRLAGKTERPPLREAPQQVEAEFDAYERGQTSVSTLYVIWRPAPLGATLVET